jgi:hypothetical protein
MDVRKLFTEDEANRLIPRLTELLSQLRQLREEGKALQIQLAGEELKIGWNGHDVSEAEIGAIHGRLGELMDAAGAIVREIQGHGCELKDVDMGLVDFPSLRDGREVYLCWRLGEPKLMYWHEIDAGFAGRQPL